MIGLATDKTSQSAKSARQSHGLGPQGHSNGARPASDLVRVRQLIDLNDKPIRLGRQETGWSRVRSSASNCICCCHNNSITLVTTNDSYLLDHIPLDNVLQAQANPSVQYLAMSNEHKLAIIELVEAQQHTDSTKSLERRRSSATGGRKRGSVKVVHLAARGLGMSDVLHWQWIDDHELALVTRGALFTCRLDQVQIPHPAMSALAHQEQHRDQILSLEKVCNLESDLSRLCQITGVQRDHSRNLYAISGLYLSASTQDIGSTCSIYTHYRSPTHNTDFETGQSSPKAKSLRHTSRSVPGQLCRMAHSDSESLQSLSTDSSRKREPPVEQSQANSPDACSHNSEQVGGLVQIYCTIRDCSQVIPAHAVAFAACRQDNSAHSTSPPLKYPHDTGCHCRVDEIGYSTTLVATIRTEDLLRVHFIGMATSRDLTTNGQSASPSTRFHNLDLHTYDFPTSVVCLMLNDDSELHVAMITTKFGWLYVCSITYGTILFGLRIVSDILSSTVPERKTRGLMVICRDGRILLVEVDSERIVQVIDESRHLKTVRSQDTAVNCVTVAPHIHSDPQTNSSHDTSFNSQSEISLDVLISTKL